MLILRYPVKINIFVVAYSNHVYIPHIGVQLHYDSSQVAWLSYLFKAEVPLAPHANRKQRNLY